MGMVMILDMYVCMPGTAPVTTMSNVLMTLMVSLLMTGLDGQSLSPDGSVVAIGAYGNDGCDEGFIEDAYEYMMSSPGRVDDPIHEVVSRVVILGIGNKFGHRLQCLEVIHRQLRPPADQ